MMKILSPVSLIALSMSSALFAATPDEISEAKGVIQRFTGKNLPSIDYGSLDAENGRPAYSTQANGGKLLLKGSNGVALCKGFYDFVRSQKGGISSWSGNRYELPAQLPESPLLKVVSPVPSHYYFNVVTYGYTMPYWNWNRWEKEIDWMALHGIDMPLALVAQEAISSRVFKRLGLTDDEIANYFVGPAHLPWMRMGNISGIDGPLPASWHKNQVALQHKILKRMRGLGMTPVAPGFSGFVPPTLTRVHPEIKLIETHWGGHFKNWMISPDQKLFSEIAKMFVEEWEKEFGKNTHYLVDSFNEMDIPFPPHNTPERYELLADYGDKVYQSIKASSPDAVWVMQGWMFGYQRYIWDEKSLAALTSKVPDEKMLLLDLAVDYSKHFWHNGANWDFYKGFSNKGWVYSVIPNMGGKTAMTGVLDFYANGHIDALESPNRGNLKGIGMAPEGFENNEVIYELMSDAGWRDKPIDLKKWLSDYSSSRYGLSHPNLSTFWENMLKSVYGTFTDHPRFNWQGRPGGSGKGSVNTSPEFEKAVEAFAACAGKMKKSPLYVADLMELTTFYLGAKIETLIQASSNAIQMGDIPLARKYEATIAQLMIGMDQLLESHPVYRLSTWLKYARLHGNTPELQNFYEKNARRIVTIWGPPVDDYAARVWSGLIRDYYLPRRQEYLKGQFDPSKKVDMANWERKWVEEQRGVSKGKPFADPVEAALKLIAKAKPITTDLLKQASGTAVGTWDPSKISTEWKEVSWSVSPSELIASPGVRFVFTRGDNKLEISNVKVEMDGKTVADITHDGTAGAPSHNNIYRFQIPKNARGNNSCHIIARVRSDGNANSFGQVELLPAIKAGK